MIVTDLAIHKRKENGLRNHDLIAVFTFDDKKLARDDWLSKFRVKVNKDDTCVDMYIVGLITHPHHLRKGYAEKTMRFFFARAVRIYRHEKKPIFVRLHTGSRNTAAMKLYEKVGMTIIDKNNESGIVEWSIKLT